MPRGSSSASERRVSLALAAEELKHPLHAKIRQILRARILTDFQHDQRFYSERELIRELQVSQGTIRRALRDLITEGYLKPAPRRGFFAQRTVPVRYVGLIVPVTHQSLANVSVEAISMACRSRDLVLNVYYLHKGEDVEDVFASIRHKPSQERILMTGFTTEFTLKLGASLDSAGYHHLVIGTRAAGFTGGSLSFDHSIAVDQVIDHLVGLGHRRICFMVNEPKQLLITSQRAEMVRRKLEERKLVESSLIFCDTKVWENSLEAAYRKTDQIWSSGVRPTAICPLSGMGAWGVLRYALLHGIRIPQDVSIVCFDPVVNTECLPVPLTELSFSYVERSEKALDLLWSDAPASCHESFQTELIIRSSTGAPSV